MYLDSIRSDVAVEKYHGDTPTVTFANIKPIFSGGSGCLPAVMRMFADLLGKALGNVDPESIGCQVMLIWNRQHLES